MVEQKKRWTAEEDQVLVQAVKANPHNKAQAFREVSQQLNRAVSSISWRWYNILSNPNHSKYVGCLFTMVGTESNMRNRTINREGVHITPNHNTNGLWNRIKRLLKKNE